MSLCDNAGGAPTSLKGRRALFPVALNRGAIFRERLHGRLPGVRRRLAVYGAVALYYRTS
jgi:hypothetical protein